MTHPYCRGKYKIDGSFSSIVYEGIAKQLIYTFKYKPFVTDIQVLLGDLFAEGLIQKELFMKACQTDAILVPIPLHNTRFRKRGYNQSSILAKKLSQKLGIPMIEMLERVKNTKSQITLSLEERKSNIFGAFALNSRHRHSGKFASGDVMQSKALQAGARMTDKSQDDTTVFLIDDILTTGSTLVEAAGILKRNGFKKVYGVTLARGK